MSLEEKAKAHRRETKRFTDMHPLAAHSYLRWIQGISKLESFRETNYSVVCLLTPRVDERLSTYLINSVTKRLSRECRSNGGKEPSELDIQSSVSDYPDLVWIGGFGDNCESAVSCAIAIADYFSNHGAFHTDARVAVGHTPYAGRIVLEHAAGDKVVVDARVGQRLQTQVEELQDRILVVSQYPTDIGGGYCDDEVVVGNCPQLPKYLSS